MGASLISNGEDLNGYFFGSQFLAEELVSHILTLEDVETLKTCRLVCKRWNTLISNCFFWKHKTLSESKHWPHVPIKEGIPWMFYASIYYHQPLERNLIKNPSGRELLKHWKVLSEGGDKFAVERPPVGAEKVPPEADLENEVDNSCFVTSYHSCSKEQVINLSDFNCLSPEVIDEFKPRIVFTDWFAGRFDCGCVYECQFILLDKHKKIIDKFEQRKTIKKCQRSQWHKVTYSFANYPDGVRFVKLYHGGMDSKFWAGHYGVKLTGSSIKINFL